MAISENQSVKRKEDPLSQAAEEAAALEDLRALIPPMRLCDQCGECCAGRLVANKEEWRQIQEYASGHDLDYRIYGDYTCGWYRREAKGCAIYPARPLLCRMYGAVRQHACAKVPGVATGDISIESLDDQYRGPWYRLNGRPLGPLESELPWSELTRPSLDLKPMRDDDARDY